MDYALDFDMLTGIKSKQNESLGHKLRRTYAPTAAKILKTTFPELGNRKLGLQIIFVSHVQNLLRFVSSMKRQIGRAHV